MKYKTNPNKLTQENLLRKLLLVEVENNKGKLDLPLMPQPQPTTEKSGCFYYDYDKNVEIFFLKLKPWEPFLSWDGKKVLIFEKVVVSEKILFIYYHDPSIKTNDLANGDLSKIIIFQIASAAINFLESDENYQGKLNVMRCITSLIPENYEEEEF